VRHERSSRCRSKPAWSLSLITLAKQGGHPDRCRIHRSYRKRIAVVERRAVNGGSRRRGTSPPAKKALLQVNVRAGNVIWLNIWVARRDANGNREAGAPVSGATGHEVNWGLSQTSCTLTRTVGRR
jgi:hypothetical protein